VTSIEGRIVAATGSSTDRPNWSSHSDEVCGIRSAKVNLVASADAPAATSALRRASKHPYLSHYNRLIAVVLLVNIWSLSYALDQDRWHIDNGSALSAISGLVLANFAIAILIRQQYVVNFLFALASRGSPRWPLWLRWLISKVYHIGGLHVGAAIAGAAWFVGLTCVESVAWSSGAATVPTGAIIVSYVLAVSLITIIVLATPLVRTRAHNLFELSHRFGGWAAVLLFWIQTIQIVLSERGGESVARALLRSSHTWILLLLTFSIVLPWLRLRKVPIKVHRPSSHVALVSLDYGVTPPVNSTVAISRNPLKEWHGFATITSPDRTGYRLAVSRAGDWSGTFIDSPPSHVWVRGIPAAALARVQDLHERIVLVVTGSGIGPAMGQVLSPKVPTHLVWSVRSPRVTYGDELVDEILRAQPDATILDTAKFGKPDMVRLTHNACQAFGATAVIVVSNKPATWQIVHGMERLGYPAFGPIWDS
jgi:hypothetical protein